MDTEKVKALIEAHRQQILQAAQHERRAQVLREAQRKGYAIGMGGPAVFGLNIEGVELWLCVKDRAIALVSWREGEGMWHVLDPVKAA